MAHRFPLEWPARSAILLSPPPTANLASEADLMGTGPDCWSTRCEHSGWPVVQALA